MNILDPGKKCVSFPIKEESEFSKDRMDDSIILAKNSFDIIVKNDKRKKLINGNFETESQNNINDHDNDNMTGSGAIELAGVTKKNDSNLNYNRKAKVTKDTVKRYKVIIKYKEVEASERTIRRAIIEDILKNS